MSRATSNTFSTLTATTATVTTLKLGRLIEFSNGTQFTPLVLAQILNRLDGLETRMRSAETRLTTEERTSAATTIAVAASENRGIARLTLVDGRLSAGLVTVTNTLSTLQSEVQTQIETLQTMIDELSGTFTDGSGTTSGAISMLQTQITSLANRASSSESQLSSINSLLLNNLVQFSN